MPAFIDTNAILDVTTRDPVWNPWSSRVINRHAPEGLFINSLVYSELCIGAESTEEVDGVIKGLRLGYMEIPSSALFFAAKAFRAYRSRGGTRTSPLPDFFIGAHAKSLGLPLITRDVNRYRTYFPEVVLITPDPS
jgi:predicted nucleic acid-binding protein